MDLNVVMGLFGAIFLGYFVQSVAGFGAMMVSIPISLLFIDRSIYLPVALLLGVYQTAAIAYKDRQYIKPKQFALALGLACVGIPLGMLAVNVLPRQTADYLLGVIIIANSGSTLLIKYFSKNKEEKVETGEVKKYIYALPIISGIFQTAWGVGGSPISAYMIKKHPKKLEYRAALSLYWTILNPFIAIGYFINGGMTYEHKFLLVALFPAIVLGLIAGNFVVKKLSQEKFALFTHCLLIFVGLLCFK